MRTALPATDITHLPEPRRLVEEVQRTGRPHVLCCGDEAVATLTPLQPPALPSRRPRRGRRTQPDNSGLLELIGITTSTDGVTDGSENKHRYHAEAD